jgi:hypothetical protein
MYNSSGGGDRLYWRVTLGMAIYWKGLFIGKINVRCAATSVRRSSPCVPFHVCYENVVLVCIYNPSTAIHFDKNLCRHVLSSRIVPEIARQAGLEGIGDIGERAQ